MYFESEPKGWIRDKELEKLFQLFKNNKLGKRNLLKKIYENYEKIRGEKPNLEKLYDTIKKIGCENTVFCLGLELILQRSEMKEYPDKTVRKGLKINDEEEFKRNSEESYGVK